MIDYEQWIEEFKSYASSCEASLEIEAEQAKKLVDDFVENHIPQLVEQLVVRGVEAEVARQLEGIEEFRRRITGEAYE